ncbi:MAG: AMP-binding protein [Thiohalocapsa sp.]|uniref:class I adenylate-forming enzyme family protein n=1 Tax=Thiohalocapsa sp. TaxID=2497641 RepID=UPI0025FE1614|nr:AMP-binding protein [Thiohalocapsa sp.]MCG6939640.1 AMP-binding protein [Thiohalocapsa sp.]
MPASDPNRPARALPQPATPALAMADTHWPAAAVAAQAAELAQRLSVAGLRAGQVALRAADDPVHLLLLQHALARLGAGLLPYPPELAAAALDALAAGVGAEWHWQRGAVMPTGRRRALAADAAWPALLVRTSGSSGVPKLVMLTAGQLLASAARVNAALDLRRGDQWLCVLPLSHIGGLAIGWRCALAGATLRLVGAGDARAPLVPRHGDVGSEPARPGFDAAAVAGALAGYPVTHVSLVPAMLARLLEVMPAPPASLRVALLGGQALHPALARRAVAAGWPLYVSYGMSETGSMIAVGRWQDDDAPGTWVGLPLPDVDLDCAGSDQAPRVLRLRGPMLMAGYADAARRPGIGLADGWLTTADLCRLDADGALRVFGRADELVVIGGEQVSPAAVEMRLAGLPGMREVAVVAVPHPTWGATLAACWSGSATPAAVDAWCRAELPGRERPRLLRRFDALPLLAAGKPDRAALRAAVVEHGEATDRAR